MHFAHMICVCWALIWSNAPFDPEHSSEAWISVFDEGLPTEDIINKLLQRLAALRKECIRLNERIDRLSSEIRKSNEDHRKLNEQDAERIRVLKEMYEKNQRPAK